MFFNTNKIPKKKIDLCLKKKVKHYRSSVKMKEYCLCCIHTVRAWCPSPEAGSSREVGPLLGPLYITLTALLLLSQKVNTLAPPPPPTQLHAVGVHACSSLGKQQQLPQTGLSNRYGNCCDGGDASQRWTCSLSLASASRRTKMYNWDLAGKRIILRLDLVLQNRESGSGIVHLS